MAEAPDTPADESPLGALRVVLVGDAAERAWWRPVLAAAGHRVVAEMAELDAALAAVERHAPGLVLVELPPAAASVLAFCEQLRARERQDAAEARDAGTRDRHAGDACYVLVAARSSEVDLMGALAAGADDLVIADPEQPQRLQARLAIAERRIAQVEARRRAEAALARARWLAGIGETSIALQHEINNPLAALLGHAALIEHGLVDPGEEREVLGVIVEQAHRIAAVVKRLAALRDPRSVPYLGDARMLNLSKGAPASAAPAPAPPPAPAPAPVPAPAPPSTAPDPEAR